MRSRAALAAVVSMIALLGCSDDGDEPAAPVTVATTAPAPATTAAPTPSTETTVEEPGCPDQAPIPAAATGLASAPLAYDGDGDGSGDALSTFLLGGQWWVHVAWAGGGSAISVIAEASADLGARPLGGHDLDGSGTDEAFVAFGGPAAGSLVAVFHSVGCSLAPVVYADSGQPFSFPVTATIGSFSGATCNGMGHIDLITGNLVDADTGEYEAGSVPYQLDPLGQMTAGFGDGASADFDEVGDLATLDCGGLGAEL